MNLQLLLATLRLGVHQLRMEESFLSRAYRVDCPRVGAVFAHVKQRHILMLFALGPKSLSEVADGCGLGLKQLHYHARALCALGLLEVVGTRPRRGRPIKLYQAISDSFLIPDECLPHPFMLELSDELRQSLAQEGFREGRATLFAIRPNGRKLARRVIARQPSASIEIFQLMDIDPAELPELEREIRAVADRFKRTGDPKSKRYIFSAAAAPRLSTI